jgi:AraC-like DNA-binding protein
MQIQNGRGSPLSSHPSPGESATLRVRTRATLIYHGDLDRMSTAPQRRPAVVYHDGPACFTGWVPRVPVCECVELIWLTRGPENLRPEKVLPNGVVELIVNLGPPHRVVDPDDPTRYHRYHDSWLAGMQRSFLVIAAEQDSELVGIRFRPGGAHALLRRPVSEFTDRVVELALVEPTLASELRERLLAAPPGLARVETVEAVLLRRLNRERRDPRIDAWLRELVAAPGDSTVAGFARRLGVSQKHLIHLCKTQVGLAPKLVARVLRFHAVIEALDRITTPRWSELAQRFGYSDQAHLISEFHAFAGDTPTGYRRGRSPDPNHLFMPG